jgi:hypothetical protein
MQKNRCLLPAIGFILAFIIQGTVMAQKPPMKFGKIEPEYFEMKSYDKDTSAEALILGKYGETAIEYDTRNLKYYLVYTYHIRIKIFNKTAYDLATHSFVLFHGANRTERIVDFEAVSYNMENGKIVESKLPKKMIYEEAIDRTRTENKFTLPNVHEGTIIEYYYKILSDYFDISNWSFQQSIPAIFSEYRVSYPEYFNYKTLMKGYLPFDINENSTEPIRLDIVEKVPAEGLQPARVYNYEFNYQCKKYRWMINNVPAFREEPYMNAFVNYYSAIEFELASYNPPQGMIQNFTQTWEKINTDLLNDEDFGLQLNRGGFLVDVVAKIKAATNDPSSQIIAAYNFIRNTMKWDGRNRVFTTTGLRGAYDKKSGSSSDINLMLVTLLRELGIESDPVIIKTRNNGIVHPAQVMVNQFNYILVSARAGENVFLMDATDKLCPYNMLPIRCINGQGRIISDKRSGWIDLNSSQRYEYTNITDVSIGADGIVTGKMQRSFTNYAALEKRNEIKNKKDNEDYIRSLEGINKGMTISDFELLNLDSLDRTFTEKLQVELLNVTQVAGNIISFTPLLYDQWNSNPFKLEKREFPVDFTYPRVYKIIMAYEVPKGYSLDEKPTDMVMTFPDGLTKFSYRLAVDGSTIRIVSMLTIGKSIYSGTEYDQLRMFFEQIVNKQAEKVVLKKTI